MKKKIIIILCVVITLLLIPIPSKMKDGGTTKYGAILYSVYDVHRIKPVDIPNEDGTYETEYVEGTVIKILGYEVFNNTDPHIEI